jgi:hypothetical protein
MIRGLRILTVQQDADYRLTEMLHGSNTLVPKLFGLLTAESDQISLGERSECLWVLANLACEATVSYRMLTEWDGYSLLI